MRKFINGKIYKFFHYTSIIGLEVVTNDDNVLRVVMENFVKEEFKMKIKLRRAKKIGEWVYVTKTKSITEKINILKSKSKSKKA